jgi:DNA (cytosine-5)-methyltransferase 1
MAGSALKQIVSDFSDLGYFLTFSVVDAAEYGSPQHRLRFVMIGSRGYPPPSLASPTHGPGLLPFVTVREAIGHLLREPGPHSVYTHPVRRFFELIPEGGNWRDLPPKLQQRAMGGAYEAGGGKTGFYRRLAWGRPAPTVTGRANRKGSGMCHPSESRPLSVLECAALQGFPPNWLLYGAMNTQYMQVGNAVPVQLGKAIGHAILAHSAADHVTVLKRNRTKKADIDKLLAAAIGRLRASGRNNRSLQA